MNDSSEIEVIRSGVSHQAVQVGVRFLRALFDDNDTVLFRPIEIWTDQGRKRSRVDYRNTCYVQASGTLLQQQVLQLHELAQNVPVNLFFGVCPRFGNKGRFDLAWQIRTVRTLWTDIDDVTAEEACERVTKANLPTPSIIVNSGNGVHLYWVLDQPYLIDDVGEPLPVETEWTESPPGAKRPRKYIIENHDRVYLDQRRDVSRFSGKAEHLQDVLAGIAKSVGGDHTTDLSRLLRLPGTLNRKNQRNGVDPVPTALVNCEPVLKYPLAAFEQLKSSDPETARAKQVAAIPLPRPRKPSSKSGKLAELIAASSVAQAGSRSEADFAVCCYAIRNRIGKEEVWSRVGHVGKFAEQGPRYFDVTWDNAEHEVRSAIFDELQKPTKSDGDAALSSPGDSNGDGGGGLRGDDQDGGNSRPTIIVKPTMMPVADTLQQVTDRLLSTRNCFTRADQLIVIHDDTIRSVLSAPELAGLLNEHVEFYFINDKVGQYKSLPTSYSNTWLNNHVERGRLPAIKLFTRNPVYTQDWRLVEPGYDEQSGIYYAGPAVEIRSGTSYMDKLLEDFCFKSTSDRTNYIGMLLTTLLIPQFVGSKPAALFNGNQPELGKSILAQIIATLRDGHPAETATYNPNDEEFEKRLGAIVRRGVTTIIIDNAKGRSRNPRIESACLERSITDPILSFRLLGSSQEIRAENSHIFCITANTSDVSRDLVTRSAFINLYYEGNPERRVFSIADPEGYAEEHRLKILGELIGMVERWKTAGMPKADFHTRFNKRGWGAIIGGILEVCGARDFLANADEAASQLDETRREFAELVGVLVERPQGPMSASKLAELCGMHGMLAGGLGDGSPRSRSTKMGTLASQFVGERFTLPDGRQALFQCTDSRKGKIYEVLAEDQMPNLGPNAEPVPNLETDQGSAP